MNDLDLNENDIEFLKKLNMKLNENNLKTFSFIKHNFLINPKNTSNDEKALYTMLVMEGFNNPKYKNCSELGMKLCNIFGNNSGRNAENLKSRLLVLGYLNSENKKKLQTTTYTQRIKELEKIKEKLLKQKGDFISLIKNENISTEYKKVIIERALKYNLAEPQKEAVLNMASDKAPVYAARNVKIYSNGRTR